MSRILTFEVPPGKPVLRGQDHYWRIMLGLDAKGPWTIRDVHGMTNGVGRDTIAEYLRRLLANDFVSQDESGPAGTLYRIKRKQVAAPKVRRDGTAGFQGRGQVQMWNLIRGPMGRDGFTFEDLALYASTATVQVKSASAASYVKHLAQAGYLACIRKPKSGKGGSLGLYRLKPAMMTGILPPLILRSQIVFDQNRGEAVGPVEAREVAP